MVHALHWFENTFNPVGMRVLDVLGALLFAMVCFVAIRRPGGSRRKGGGAPRRRDSSSANDVDAEAERVVEETPPVPAPNAPRSDHGGH